VTLEGIPAPNALPPGQIRVHVYSEDIRGLHLSGEMERIRLMIPVAAEALLRSRFQKGQSLFS
jgi:hypothetical protein